MKPQFEKEKAIRVNVSMPPSLADKFKRLGASKWLQWAVRRAPEPKREKKNVR